MSEIDKPTKAAIVATDIVSDSDQIEATHSDSDSIWLHQGTTVSNTEINRVRNCDFLRLVRIDIHDSEMVMLCDIVR